MVQGNDPPFEVTDIDTTKYRVFLKHHLGEMEIDNSAVLMHVRITGALPVVGQPMRMLPRETYAQHKRFAIPFGVVARVEQCLGQPTRSA